MGIDKSETTTQLIWGHQHSKGRQLTRRFEFWYALSTIFRLILAKREWEYDSCLSSAFANNILEHSYYMLQLDKGSHAMPMRNKYASDVNATAASNPTVTRCHALVSVTKAGCRRLAYGTGLTEFYGMLCSLIITYRKRMSSHNHDENRMEILVAADVFEENTASNVFS
uniref:DUF4372 domain-containing protein n=1 Tax=Ascaris lumbricoides TaxID=6252 RepID=A0A0M3HT84_ASCLU